MHDNPSFIRVPVILSRTCLYMFQGPASRPQPSPPRVAARPYGQAGAVREAAGGGAGKARGKRRAGGAGKARWRTVSVPAAVRDELRESPRKLARKFPDSRRNGVDSCQKGELASLLYPEMPGGIPPGN